MPSIHIRIIELLTKEKHSSINSFHVLAHASSNPTQVFKLKISKDKYSNVLSGDKPSSMPIFSQINNYLCIDFKRFHLITKDDLIGQLVLPLEWFPTNHIVREWFPIQRSTDCQVGMILLDVHIDSRNVAPFMAPFATLRVFPMWKKPTFGENCEIPVIPPVVYIISPNENTFSNQNQNNNMIPQAQEYVNVTSFPINPYSVNGNRPNVSSDFDDINQQHLMMQNQCDQCQIEQNQINKNQVNQNQKPFQIYSMDMSDDENEKLNNENQNEQQSNYQQYSSVYYPNLNQVLYND